MSGVDLGRAAAPDETTILRFRRLLEQRAVGIVSFDVGWCGGISEARQIIALADAYYATCNAAATPSLTTSVATTPNIGIQYSATQTWPVTPVTSIR